MKKSDSYINHLQPGSYIIVVLICLLIFACNPTKYVPAGESLLNKNYVNVKNDIIKKTDLLPYLKQVPNKKIFGTRFYLGLYNLSDINKTRWPHGWLRNIGEEPVIFDADATRRTRDQIRSYVSSKGYFDGIVTDSVKTEKRKSDVYYNVELKRPYTIRNLKYQIADTNLRRLCYFDSVNCVILRGKPYDVDILQLERTRMERYIRDHGFYGFTNDYISFGVDSTVGNRQVDIKYIIRGFTHLNNDNRIISEPFSVYSLRNIYIYPDFIPKDALENGDAYFKGMDTTFYNGYYFVTNYKRKPEIKYDLILQSVYLKAGSVYSVTGTEQTQSHLLGLKTYRLVNISYNDANGNDNNKGSDLGLNCNIQLTLLNQQSYKIELEGTNSAGNFGGATNFIYQHKNLFHGAELFSIKLKGAYAAYAQNKSLSSTKEYGVETSLQLPEFVIPFFKKEIFIKKFNPTTTLQASWDYQDMPFYRRATANASFGYTWKSGFYKTHIVNPLQFNFVNILSIDSTYQAWINSSTYQANSYKDVLILGGGYSFIYNNQKIKNSRDFWFIRINAETAGNILDIGERLSGRKRTIAIDSTSEGTIIDSTRTFKIFGQPFAQYVKADIDVRYNYKFNDVSSIVYRGYIGLGFPYGNSKALPFEKQFFSGGANGIRAWQVRSLGPGSYNPGNKSRYLNETADIKLEANAEYRFKLFWILESAFFIDAGNIWSFNYDKDRPGSQFTFRHFYKDIAVGTGTGFRFDFKYIIARIDVGMKLRDPLLPGSSRWIILNRKYQKDDFAVVLGIGYPF